MMATVLLFCIVIFGWLLCIRQWERQFPAGQQLARRYAHRGLWDSRHPENSLSAFRQAWEMGCAVELDVQLTLDGQVVVFHDGDTGRMCGRSLSIARSLWKELQELTLLDSCERIPTLQQVLASWDGHHPLLVEIKDSPQLRLLCQKVQHLMAHTGHPWAVESFHPGAVRYFRRHAPDVPRGQLVPDKLRHRSSLLRRMGNVILRSMAYIPWARPHFLAVSPRTLSSLPLRLMGRRRPPVLIWTVRSPDAEKHALRQCQGVIFEGYREKP